MSWSMLFPSVCLIPPCRAQNCTCMMMDTRATKVIEACCFVLLFALHRAAIVEACSSAMLSCSEFALQSVQLEIQSLLCITASRVCRSNMNMLVCVKHDYPRACTHARAVLPTRVCTPKERSCTYLNMYISMIMLTSTGRHAHYHTHTHTYI